MSTFYLISGRVPFVLVDDAGEPAGLDTLDEAREAADQSFSTRAMGCVIVECDDRGIVGVHEP